MTREWRDISVHGSPYEEEIDVRSDPPQFRHRLIVRYDVAFGVGGMRLTHDWIHGRRPDAGSI